MRGLRGLGLGLRLGPSGPPPLVLPDSIAFTNTANTTAVLQGDGSYLITKTSADGWDGAAATAASFAGDYMTVVRTYASDKNFFAGASLTPTGTSDNTGFSRALNGGGAGTIFAIEDGSLTGIDNAYLANEYWFLKRVAGAHTVSHGLTADPGAATLIGAMGLTNSASAAGMKVSLYYNTSQLNVRAYEL